MQMALLSLLSRRSTRTDLNPTMYCQSNVGSDFVLKFWQTCYFKTPGCCLLLVQCPSALCQPPGDLLFGSVKARRFSLSVEYVHRPLSSICLFLSLPLSYCLKSSSLTQYRVALHMDFQGSYINESQYLYANHSYCKFLLRQWERFILL